MKIREPGFMVMSFVVIGVVGSIIYNVQSGDVLVVDSQQWMSSARVERTPSPPAVREVVAEAEAVADCPVGDMAPPASIQAAFEEVEQRVTFEATAILESELSSEVAKQMVAAAELYWRDYQTMLAMERDADMDSSLARANYLFALWPDLPELIKKRQVGVRVSPRPQHLARLWCGMVHSTYLAKQRSFNYSFQMPDWNVSLDCSDARVLPELFAQVEETAKRSMAIDNDKK